MGATLLDIEDLNGPSPALRANRALRTNSHRESCAAHPAPAPAFGTQP